MNEKKRLRGSLLLLLAAIVWGVAFTAQSKGTDYVGPFTFNALRSFIGGIVLLPVAAVIRSRRKEPAAPEEKSVTLKGGVVCGLFLSAASALQQSGIADTTAGKAGFITALYVIFVPIFGLFLKKRMPGKIWLCAVIAVTGFWLLSVREGFSVSRGDLLVLGCAFGFTFHIMCIDRYMEKGADGVLLSCVQFFTAGVVNLVPMLFFEEPSLGAVRAAAGTILYAGVMSSGVGYTLQILGQRDTEPGTAALLMSLESVFAALAGWVILKETMNTRELIGCALVFLAVILAQLPERKNRKGLEKDASGDIV